METAAEEEKQMLPLYSVLPPQIRKKIKALKKLQLESISIESKYFNDVLRLESKYAAMHSEIFARRSDIIQGKVEPTSEECDFNDGYISPDENDPTVEDLRKRFAEMKVFEREFTGIPEFWLTVLKNAGKTFDLVKPHDEPVLKYLVDIRVTLDVEPMGFTVGFRFSQNPYFTNKVLTKQYDMRCEVDEADPWSFDGPEIVKARGCRIEWKPNMDVTLKPGVKVASRKKRENPDLELMKMESFFDFFSPPEVTGSQGEGSDELHCALAEDYALGVFLREKLVPNAVLYYTGDAIDTDNSSSESESEPSDESEQEDSESESANFQIGEDNPSFKLEEANEA